MSHNTKDGITAQLGSYASFYAVMHLRNKRGRYRSEGTQNEEHSRPTPLTVIGRYRSDESGQCWRLNRQMFTDADRTAMPTVMTDEEFHAFFEQNVKPRITESWCIIHEGISGMAPAFPLPPPHLVCAKCGGTWELNQCHDIDAEGDFEDIDLYMFVGKTLREVESELATRTDALRAFGYPLDVQNQQWVDPNSEEQWATPEQRGWRDVSWDYVVQTGDHASMFRYRFYHGECFRQLGSERAAAKEVANVDDMKQMLEETGFENVRITRVPLPEHLRRWAAADLDEGESIDEIAEAFAYYRVKTKQGTFGIAVAAYPMLDLEGSGVALHDLEPQLAAEAPPDFPAITGFSGELEQLLRLWQLMVKHQSQK